MDNIEEFFTDKAFTMTHDVVRNFALISYFFDLSKSDKSKELNEKLKNIPFIFANGEKLKSPQTLCFPSLDYETEYHLVGERAVGRHRHVELGVNFSEGKVDELSLEGFGEGVRAVLA